MGLLDGLRDLFGFGAETSAQRAADPDDLFGMSTAYVTMAADLDYEPVGQAALCFAGVDSTDFHQTLSEVRSLVEAGDEGTVAEVTEDEYGYHWVVLADDDFEDLVVGVNAAADEFTTRGYGSRLLAAVFGFRRSTDAGSAGSGTGSGSDADGSSAAGDADRVYWIYSFRRGAYYPFAPRGDHERDHGVEFKLQSVLDGELDVDDDESYWYPLWPDDPHGHPWE